MSIQVTFSSSVPVEAVAEGSRDQDGRLVWNILTVMVGGRDRGIDVRDFVQSGSFAKLYKDAKIQMKRDVDRADEESPIIKIVPGLGVKT